ncbi:MAG: ATP-binding protein [Bacteroidetes bacterium]|nr:ATP-binding protein [Bacteroidales bacterium]NJO68289.1 ATP-binding protein [Bacteroidota bacterium]
MNKKINKLLLTCAVIISGSIYDTDAQEKFQHERLITIWETKKDLKTPESLVYDDENDLLFVSNVNMNPWEKDGNGFITKMNLKGDILEANWIKGLSGPKGMGVHKGKLYVSDIDEIVEIDIKKGEVLNKYKVEGAKKLNDVTVDKSGTVYVSDMGDATIYSLKKGKLDIFVKSAELQNINGVFAQGNTLIAGLANRVVSIDVTTKSIKTLVDNTGGVDGVVATGKGTYIISDWQGHVNEIKEGQKPLLLLDTTPIQTNAADIEFVKEKGILLVPTFFKDGVVAYQVSFPK